MFVLLSTVNIPLVFGDFLITLVKNKQKYFCNIKIELNYVSYKQITHLFTPKPRKSWLVYNVLLKRQNWMTFPQLYLFFAQAGERSLFYIYIFLWTWIYLIWKVFKDALKAFDNFKNKQKLFEIMFFDM